MKKISISTLLTGIALLSLGYLIPIMIILLTPQQDSIGIIGGADGPTAIFLTSKLFFNFPLLLKLFGVSIALSGLFCLIFTKTVDENCYAETSIVALALSAIVGLGFYSVVLYLSSIFLTQTDEHPIAHPGSIILGILAFIVFIVLLCFYIKSRKTKPSAKGVLIDILFSLMFIVPFFFLFMEVGERISDLF